jgi:MerR family transcriptional regulator/heat shock protein HspR
MANSRDSRSRATYVISIAAELAGVHPQTLRVYERKGLLRPQRTEGNTRRYSDDDITTLRRIQALTNEGINLAGVLKVMELELELARFEVRYDRALRELDEVRAQMQELLSASDHSSMVPLRDVRRVRRAMKADMVDEAGRPRVWPAPPVGGLGDDR